MTPQQDVQCRTQAEWSNALSGSLQVFEVVSELVVANGSGTGDSQAEDNRQRLAKQLEALLHKVLTRRTHEHLVSLSVCSADMIYACFVTLAVNTVITSRNSDQAASVYIICAVH